MVAVAAAVIVHVAVSPPSATTPPRPSFLPVPPSNSPTPVTLPATVMCVNDTSRDTAALQAAVAGGGTVVIGAGTCAVDARITVKAAMVITGQSQSATILIQHARSNIFEIIAPGVTVENMTLDTAMYNTTPPVLKNPDPGVLFSNSSHTTIRNVTARAGTGFGMRITGPNPCQTDQTTGTVVQNVNVTDGGIGGFASVDVDCTNGAVLSDITIHGGILALFFDQNITLTGENYTGDNPNFRCQPAWFVTGGSNFLISNIASNAGPGRVTQNATNVSVTNQTAAAGC